VNEIPEREPAQENQSDQRAPEVAGQGEPPETRIRVTEPPLTGFEPAAQPSYAPPRRDPVWTGWDVVMIAVVAVVGIFVFGSLIGLAFTVTSHTLPTAPAHALRIVLIAQVLAYGAVLWYMRHLVVGHYHARFDSAVRWHWPGANWFAWIAAGFLLAVFVQLISVLLPIPRTLPIDRYFQNRTAAWMMSIFGISMAPLVEELFFRGFLYPVLARRLGIAIGAVATAIAFALMHASQLANAWAPLLILFIVGLVFTLVRVFRNAVAPTFLMHVGYNLTLFTMLYFSTDHFRHMEKMLQQ
jgi:membrane protease YdiL (CAAX protease family)